jgi:uncharacterized protein (DUF433 family)
MKIDQTVIRSDPEVMSGAPVFAGTRVLVQNLIDYLSAGDTIDNFLEDFPTVGREQALAALDWVREALTRDSHPTLDDLLQGITDENRHEETDTGPPVGRETW